MNHTDRPAGDMYVTVLRTQYDEMVSVRAEMVRLRGILQGTVNALRAAGLPGAADELVDALEHEGVEVAR